MVRRCKKYHLTLGQDSTSPLFFLYSCEAFNLSVGQQVDWSGADRFLRSRGRTSYRSLDLPGVAASRPCGKYADFLQKTLGYPVSLGPSHRVCHLAQHYGAGAPWRSRASCEKDQARLPSKTAQQLRQCPPWDGWMTSISTSTTSPTSFSSHPSFTFPAGIAQTPGWTQRFQELEVLNANRSRHRGEHTMEAQPWRLSGPQRWENL